MIRNTLAIIKKNLKLLIRSKTSALVVILGPLFLILLVGAAFNTSNLYNIKVGSYSESYPTLTDSLVNQLTEKGFKTTKTDSLDMCVEGVKRGEYHVCAVFPPDMDVNKENNEIQFYVDNSRANLVWIVLDSISEEISAKSEELSTQMTQRLLDAITKTETEIGNKGAVLTDIAAHNQEVKSTVESVYSNLEGLDLEFNLSEFNFTNIGDETDDLEEECNRSFDDLEDMVEGMEAKVIVLGAKLTNAASSTKGSKVNLISAKQALTSDLTKINSIKSAIETALEDISHIEVKSARKIAVPVTTTIKPVTTEKTHLNYLFPTLLVIIIMFIGLLVSSTTVIREKVSPAYFRNFITPTNDLIFLIAHYLTNIFVLALQLGVIIGIASFFFKEEIVNSLGNISIALLVIATTFITLGMLIGYLFRTEETSSLASISFASLFLFFSNLILPIESLPVYITEIVKYNPFMIAEDMIKKLFLFGVEIESVLPNIQILLIYSAAFVVLIGVCHLIIKEARRIRKHFYHETISRQPSEETSSK